MDVFSREKRSEVMSRVRSKDTGPELIVRRSLHRSGLRFRLHRRDLPGQPDIVLPSRKVVVFVHGCFWHGHSCRRGARVPKTNTDYWLKKIRRNEVRDEENNYALIALGWGVLVLWECEIKDAEKLDETLLNFLE